MWGNINKDQDWITLISLTCHPKHDEDICNMLFTLYEIAPPLLHGKNCQNIDAPFVLLYVWAWILAYDLDLYNNLVIVFVHVDDKSTASQMLPNAFSLCNLKKECISAKYKKPEPVDFCYQSGNDAKVNNQVPIRIY